mmetsp:Transcript_22152/g.36699  ORF Transcript_22152/g.36699 Transcript_22152/m.36699 type:complete len:175 (+) Transcript_22152:80-604(+)
MGQEILVLGCSGAGKSLLVKQLKNIASNGFASPLEACDSQPTIGVELDKIQIRKKRIDVRELGGTLVEVWPKYFPASLAVIFVVDASDPVMLSSAVVELHSLLADQALLRNPFLLLFNKSDAPLICPELVLSEIFRLDDIKRHRPNDDFFKVVHGSTVTGEHIQEILQWLCMLL